jgi:hypothetical protein
MSEQAIQATISNRMMGKVFTKTATDDVWDGNTLTDSLSSQQIGILMPRSSVNRVQLQYTAGLCAWRIQNSANLTFQRFGFGVKDGLACFSSSSIQPYVINPNDILTVYPLPIEATIEETNALAWVQTTKGVELFEAKAIPDGTATEMKTVVNEQTLGDSMFNSTLQSIHIQAEDGATVDSVEIIDNSGGTVLTLFGGVRGDTMGAVDLTYNLKADGLSVPVGKGYALKITTTSSA